MSYRRYLRELLAPLRLYDLEAPFNGGELTAAGEALDGAFGALEEVERESSLLTARSWGLEGLAALLLHRPAAETEEGLGQALAALLRIGDDSFTPEAINDTIVGCGVAAECTETGVGRVRVRFPGVVGVPAQIVEAEDGFALADVLLERDVPGEDPVYVVPGDDDEYYRYNPSAKNRNE